MPSKARVTSEQPRPLRADAERNRRRVLEVAQHVFAKSGVNVPIDEIAKAAGLGVGTLYRHFPTKEALVVAIVCEDMGESTKNIREAAASGEAAGEKFFSFLTRMIEGWSQKKAFMEMLHSGNVDLSELVRAKQKFHEALGKLLERAQAEGSVRGGITELEVMAVVSSTIMTLDRHDISPEGRERVLAMFYDGLRPPVIPAPARKARNRAAS